MNYNIDLSLNKREMPATVKYDIPILSKFNLLVVSPTTFV